MKFSPECVPYILERVLALARKISDDEWFHMKVLNHVMSKFPSIDCDRTTAEVSFDAITIAAKKAGAVDPYAETKRSANEKIMECEKAMKKLIDSSDDRLLAAVKLSIKGNMLDMETAATLDIDREFESMPDFEPDPAAYGEFKDAVDKASTIMFIHNNAGEIVLDKLLIAEMTDKDVTSVVRYSPVLNDATKDDAQFVGLDACAKVIDPGIESLGIILRVSSEEFKKEFRNADMVVAKGRENFETLEDCGREVFFLLAAKSGLIAKYLGVPQGSPLLIKRDRNVEK